MNGQTEKPQGAVRNKRKKAALFTTYYIVRVALFAALAFALMFVKIDYPLFPWLAFDLADVPILLAGFSMGPLAALLSALVKNLLHLSATRTAFVGELANFIMGGAFACSASLVYRHIRKFKGAAIGLAVAVPLALGVAVIVNIFIMAPLYKLNDELAKLAVFGRVPTMGDYILVGVVPFNIIKYTFAALATLPLYKPLSKVLKLGSKAISRVLEEGEGDLFNGILTAKTEAATRDIAARLAALLRGGDVVLLTGDLGSGKTAFVKGAAAALGAKEEVTSPTFTYLKSYAMNPAGGAEVLCHYDFYRLETPEKAFELGLAENLGQPDYICFIEWPERAAGLLPERVYRVEISGSGEEPRKIIIAPPKAASETGAKKEKEETKEGAKDLGV